MGREWLKTQRAPLLHPEMPSPHKKARHRSPTPPTSAAFPTPTTPKLLLPAPPATPMRLLGSSRLGEKTDTGDESQSRSPTNEDPVKTVKGVTAHDTGAEKDKDKRENLLKRGLESATDTGEGPSGDKAASVVAKGPSFINVHPKLTVLNKKCTYCWSFEWEQTTKKNT